MKVIQEHFIQLNINFISSASRAGNDGLLKMTKG